MDEATLRQRLEQERVQALRQRREFMRWIALMAANINRPTPSTLRFLLSVVKGEYADATELELRRELDYLAERELLTLRTDPLGQVSVKLERYGIDIVEYTIDCEAGIARPPVA